MRVSTEDQAKEGCSLANQKEKIASYAALNDLDLVDMVADEGVSGSSLNRAGVQILVSLVKHGKVDAVIVYKLDRLSRRVRDALALLDLINEKSVAFHSITERIDTQSAMGKFFLNIMANMNQWEVDTIRERTRDALAHNIRNHERVGQLPLGYDLAEDGKTLVENPKEQKAVRLIVRLRGLGYSYRGIIAELEAKGYEAKRGPLAPVKIGNVLRYQTRRLATV